MIPRTRPMYRHLVTALEQRISAGDVGPGLRLPTERDVARVLRISRTTVVTAYRELESRGLVRGYVGRGTYVSARPDPGSAPFAWRGKVSAAALQSADPAVLDIINAAADPSIRSLAAGQPALDQFPEREFKHAVDRVLTRDGRTPWALGPTEGVGVLKRAIAARFGGHADNILVIAGAQQGLDLLARCLIDPGDVVVIDRPGYLGAILSFRSAGARLVGWDVLRADLGELEELFARYRPKLFYLNPTHQNPTGMTLPLRVRRDLLELAERYRVPIVEDDTYRELTLSAPPPPSLAALDERRSIVIHLNTFSKMLAPGLRLGWIGAARPIVEQLTLIKQRVDPNTQNLSQLVLAELIETGVFDRHLTGLRAEHRRRRDALARAISKAVDPAHLRFQVPAGGLYFWCQLGSGLRARAVQRAARRDGLAVVTGEPFYADGGGIAELRLCFTAQPATDADRIAVSLDAALGAAHHDAL